MKTPKLEPCPTHKKKPTVKYSFRDKTWTVRCRGKNGPNCPCACVGSPDKKTAIEIWNYVVTEPIFLGSITWVEKLPNK